MSEEFQTALSLMAIGMITVAFILFLVVVVGNLIVRVTNTIKIPVVKSTIHKQAQSFSANKMAAIVAAVNQVTQGKGNVDKIEKIN